MMIRVGVIGFGYWGKNIARNFHQHEGTALVAICDKDKKNLKAAEKLYPCLKLYSDYQAFLDQSDIDLVAIVTPTATHYPLAKLSLEKGKHVFVEKPFTSTSAQAKHLIDLAEKKHKLLMVDHTFLFTPSVQKIKEFIDTDVIGNIHYYDSQRTNLGRFQEDSNVIWDLATHDLSIIDYLIDSPPLSISAHGMDHLKRGFENTGFVTLFFDHTICHMTVNWMFPVKIRKTVIGGDKRMLIWDDLENDEKIKVYDKGIKVSGSNPLEKNRQLRIGYRVGNAWMPPIENKEALEIEIGYIVSCLKQNKTPVNGGVAGLRVIELLEACDLSIKEGGKKINLYLSSYLPTYRENFSLVKQKK